MNELIEFSLDTENGEKNYQLARWYENNGYISPALSYYLRAAERLTYEKSYASLIRGSFCYKTEGSRDGTEKILLENALMLLPERPEAYYFLSLLYERKGEWQNSYIYANLGLQNSEVSSLEKIPEYPGKHVLIFQKSIAGWWWGKGMESRKLLQILVNEYWDVLDDAHKKSVESNITRLGSGPDSVSFCPYTKESYNKLRYKFRDSDTIEKNYSQVYQDMFILSMLNGKRNGTYIEIGGSDPFKGNNTALLEQSYNWAGVSIEYNEKFIQNYRNQRRYTKVIHDDALTIDYKKLLRENFSTNSIDYLQLDIEPARNTYECMLRIPFDEYKFAVITYEHDYYVDVTRSYRDKSREFLKSKGYVLVANDISPDGICNFEDWWVHPELVDSKILEIMKSETNTTQDVKEYMLTPSKLDLFAISQN